MKKICPVLFFLLFQSCNTPAYHWAFEHVFDVDVKFEKEKYEVDASAQEIVLKVTPFFYGWDSGGTSETMDPYSERVSWSDTSDVVFKQYEWFSVEFERGYATDVKVHLEANMTRRQRRIQIKVWRQNGDIFGLAETVIIQQPTIDIQSALDKLDRFYECGEQMTKTQKSIQSITPYYKNAGVLTKGEEEQPSAYLVNYTNDSGFAVLGATPSIPDIVAVVENGHINDDLSVCFSSEWTINDDAEPFNGPVFCEEDGDYYSDSHLPDSLVSDIIRNCVLIGEDPAPGSNHSYYEKLPLLSYSWGQSDAVYSKYCRCVLSSAPAFCGCSSTALAMIMTHQEYPQSLTLNGDIVDWAAMKTAYCAYNLSLTSAKEDVSKLCGMIFNHIKPNMITSSGNFTMITPEQIKRVMGLLGFENVVKHSGSSLNESMITVISNMLRHNKPVFISALPWAFWSAHSWVIDGARYSQGGTYLLHCNFGWNGVSNGYFAISGLNPTAGGSYDNPSLDNHQSVHNHTFVTHFRVISYDIPQNQYPYDITYNW